jgi:hypothetical protein
MFRHSRLPRACRGGASGNPAFFWVPAFAGTTKSTKQSSSKGLIIGSLLRGVVLSPELCRMACHERAKQVEWVEQMVFGFKNPETGTHLKQLLDNQLMYLIYKYFLDGLSDHKCPDSCRHAGRQQAGYYSLLHEQEPPWPPSFAVKGNLNCRMDYAYPVLEALP